MPELDYTEPRAQCQPVTPKSHPIGLAITVANISANWASTERTDARTVLTTVPDRAGKGSHARTATRSAGHPRRVGREICLLAAAKGVARVFHRQKRCTSRASRYLGVGGIHSGKVSEPRLGVEGADGPACLHGVRRNDQIACPTGHSSCATS